MLKLPALCKTDIRDFVLLVDPQVAEHFIIEIIKGHTVFPFFGDPVIKLFNVHSEKNQTALHGLALMREKIIKRRKKDQRVKI